jgi:cytoskeleton protein RodZ
MSTVSSAVTEPPAAVRAGADLRAARERLGASLQDVASTLRIRVPHLEALEEGRISLLPGTAYALAFVRTYANALGLDAEEMVRRFRTEAAEFNQRTELVFPVPMPERGLPAGAIVLLGLVLAVGAYAGWYRLSGEGRLPAETVTAIPERLAPLAEQALPPSPASAPSGSGSAGAASSGLASSGPVLPGSLTNDPTAVGSGSAGQRVTQVDPQALASLANAAPPVMAISPTSAAAAQVPFRTTDGSSAASVAAVPAVAPPTVASPDAPRMVLHASADAWVMVKDRAGTVLLNRVLKPGETWPVPPRSDLLLTAGNAGGTDILVDGAATPSLGGSGTVRRDLPLDPDQVKDGKLAGSLAPQLASGRVRSGSGSGTVGGSGSGASGSGGSGSGGSSGAGQTTP